MTPPPPIQQLRDAQAAATSYEDWQRIAQEIDALENLEKWRRNDQSDLYDYRQLRHQLTELRRARESRNYLKLIYLVRTTFSRNVANMGDPRLYAVSHYGTKMLIEDYITECEAALRYLATLQVGLDQLKSILTTLVQARKAFGRTALVLSGGSVLGFMHIGIMRELITQNLLPKIVSGSSAGSIFASILCIHRDEEFEKMWELLRIPMNIFEKAGQEESLLTHLKRFCTVGTWIDSTYLREMMQGLIGDITFREAYNRTGRILNVNVSVAGSHEMPRVLNYLTAPNVVIWSAVVCSCSVPLVFQADNILAKHPKTKKLSLWTNRPFIDGSVDNDMPLGRLAEIFNVNHFVASQVNPHIAPLFNQDRASRDVKLPKAEQVSGNWLTNGLTQTWNWSRSLFLNEMEYGLMMLKTARIAPSVACTVLNVIRQEYWGDITFVPPIKLTDFKNLFKNPTNEAIAELIERGQRACWPKMALLRNHCAVELALDRAIVELRSRIISQPGSCLNGVKLTNGNRMDDNHMDETPLNETPLNETHAKFGDGDDSLYPLRKNRSNPPLPVLIHPKSMPKPVSHYRSSIPASPTAVRSKLRKSRDQTRVTRGRSRSSSSLVLPGQFFDRRRGLEDGDLKRRASLNVPVKSDEPETGVAE